jgi:hypothetical protein
MDRYQAEGFATAPQGNVTQASHKYVTKQNLPSPKRPTHLIPGRRNSLREDGGERVVTLGRGELFVVPQGVFHKPSSRDGAVVLLVEPTGTLSVGDDHDEVPDHVEVTTGHRL